MQEAATLANAIEVGGETFVPLPYSNPDLPVNESRIVEMQVPVSALNDIGIVLGAGLEPGGGDRMARCWRMY